MVFLLAMAPQRLALVMGATLAVTALVVMGDCTALAAKVLAPLQSAAHMRSLRRLFGALFVMAALVASLKPAA